MAAWQWRDVHEAFDRIDIIAKAARIYLMLNF
jgi:hypothetical protein